MGDILPLWEVKIHPPFGHGSSWENGPTWFKKGPICTIQGTHVMHRHYFVKGYVGGVGMYPCRRHICGLGFLFGVS